ncbi:MAG TPA: T9SS type A sorting domain-containing protein, partial [Bacteroidetes bacterium]|nr:T9SS type A sorting domain-containing protein [Bacteroidota bacterium]
DTCSFAINVVEYVPATPAIVTDDNLWISIPSTCEMFLMPAMVLEGNYGCYDDFVIDVENTGSNYIGPYYVGQTISYTITNTETGMTGWGEAGIEDKSPPLLTGCDTARVNCLADVRPVSEGGIIPDPGIVDCNPFTSNYTDMETQGTCQDTFTSVVMRVWTASDALGNVGSCNQIIIVDRTYLTDITPQCPANTSVECSIGVAPDFSPSVTGYPTAVIDGQTYNITDGANAICNITASYNDQIISGCGASFKIIRMWTIMDWCLPLDFINNPWTCTQIIEYTDTTPPVVSAPADMTVSADLSGCRARPVIPPVSPADCSGFSVFITTPVGPLSANGGQVPAPGLPLGTHNIDIKVTDDCGRATTVSFTITVEDQTQPNPVCDAHTVVALNNTGYGLALATSFDDGSTDNCCLDYFEVARVSDNCGIADNLTFRDRIEFCCADVGQTVNAIIRVWDCYGNSNICNIEIEVQDINGPSITCPPDVTLYCGENYADPNVTGEVVTDPAMQGAIDGLAQDNCGAAIQVTSSDMGQVSCGSGIIQRTYQVTDPAGASSSCLQTITVVNNNPFTGANITFPPDTTVTSCDALVDPAATGIPVFPPPSGCHSLVYGHDPDLELVANNACRKIQRRWYVIDWCQYDPNNPNSPGIWSQVQTITVMDNEGPTFAACDNLTFCNFKNDCSDIAPDLSVAATDACTDDNLLTYTWTVDLFNDGLPDPPGYAASGMGQNTTNDYPIGTHQISYTAHDGCGNTGNCSFLFTIDDCKNPAAICNGGIVVELMQTGMIPVRVAQLEEGASSDNCTTRDDLRFSFSSDLADTLRILDCNNIGQNILEVWVTDQAGNQDFCTTPVVVQDNMNACGGSPLIALTGAIADENHNAVENVEVELNGNLNSMVQTNSDGVFVFDNLPQGEDYTITPQLDTDPLNGVTTFDLYLLQRHILGIELLDSPYKIIAADANKSGSVTTFDVVEIRKVILYVEPAFPNNTSWRFVDNSYTFPNPANPFEEVFPEVYNINNLTTGSQSPNFMAIKVGDLNNTATGSLSAMAEDRSQHSELVFSTSDRAVKTGERISVPISADLDDILAWQFTLGFDKDKLELTAVVPGTDLTEANFGTTHLNEGWLTLSWFRGVHSSAQNTSPVFVLKFLVKEGGMLSEMIHIGSHLTFAEGYGPDGTPHSIRLGFEPAVAPVAFQLFQNIPNPFNNTTIVGFQLPEASGASLTIFDVSGKILKRITGQYTRGYHEISIDNNALPGHGVFYYRIETPTHTATRKMTRI